MMTKRMMLGAGALALALTLTACSEDRAGGATGVNEQAISAPRAAPPPAEVAAPPEIGSTRPPVGSDEGVSFATNGHQYSIQVGPSPNGGDVTRIFQDGAILLEAAGTPASLATATEANITLFFEGQAVFSDWVELRGTPLAAIPEQFRSAQRAPDGPQLQMAMPCMTELGLFGSASAWLSLELFLARNGAGSWTRLRAAGGAVIASGMALFNCLEMHW